MGETSDENLATPKNQTTPIILLQRAKRIPKRLWNTPEAQVRRLKLRSESQRRYRARKAAERRIEEERGRKNYESSSSSDSDEVMSGIAALDSDSSASDDDQVQVQQEYPDEGTLAANQNLLRMEDNGNTFVLHQEDVEPDEEEDDLAIIVKKFAQIKVSSNVSDAAIEKLFRMFCEEKERLSRLLAQRRITKSFRKSIRPQAIKCIPTVFCSYYIQEKQDDEQNILYKTSDVREIPTKYLNLPATSNQILLRMESYVKLPDIKRSYIRKHGTQNIKEHFANCHVSVDGVKESAKGKRTFIIVTLRINKCLYVYRVFNPLMGNQASKPSPVELLR